MTPPTYLTYGAVELLRKSGNDRKHFERVVRGRHGLRKLALKGPSGNVALTQRFMKSQGPETQYRTHLEDASTNTVKAG